MAPSARGFYLAAPAQTPLPCAMHWNCWNLLALLLLLSGCASRPKTGPSSSPADRPNSGPGSTIVTPAEPSIGRITLVRASAGYVIVTYTLGQLPARDSRLQVYRNGLKVAELKVTDLSRDVNAVAEVLAGECQVNDEVRAH